MSRLVREEELPGIGRRYSIDCDYGAVLTIVVHNSGRRDIYFFPPDSEMPVTVAMNDEQAKVAGAILTGGLSPPAAITEIEQVVDDLAIEWYTLSPGSPGTGQTIEELHIRSATGINVMTILRGHAVIHGPRDSERLEPGDRLIVAGRHSSMPAFRRLVVGD